MMEKSSISLRLPERKVIYTPMREIMIDGAYMISSTVFFFTRRLRKRRMRNLPMRKIITLMKKSDSL